MAHTGGESGAEGVEAGVWMEGFLQELRLWWYVEGVEGWVEGIDRSSFYVIDECHLARMEHAAGLMSTVAMPVHV